MKENDFCRCCLSKECYKDMANEYYIGNKTENYFKMLMNIFSVNISNKGPHRSLICEECVSKLRDAAAFKEQVLNTQESIRNLSYLMRSNDSGSEFELKIVEDEDDFDDHLSDHINDSHFIWDDTESPRRGEIFAIEVDDIEEDVPKAIYIKPGNVKKKSEVPQIHDEIKNTKLIGIRTYSRAKSKKAISTQNNCSTENMNSISTENKCNIDNTSAFSTNSSSSAEKASAIVTKRDIDESKSNTATENVPAKRERTKEDTDKNKEKRKLKKKKEEQISETQKKLIHERENTFHLVQNSNILLFRPLKNKFGCNLCRSDFLDLKQLREHTFNHTDIKRMALKIKNLQGLSYKNADISDLKCNLCSENCTDLANLQNHLNHKHDILFNGTGHYLIPYNLQNGFQCVICESKFKNYLHLSIHMNCHYSNHVCEVCGQSYINRISLRSHLAARHRQTTCSICSAIFVDHSSKMTHMRIVHKISNSKRYCILCKKSFRYTYLLQEHKIKEHGFKRQISTCKECGKTFGSETNLNLHIRSVHIGERNYSCSDCSRSFFTKCDLKRHETSHVDVRSFSCSQCDTKLKSKDSLRRHLKMKHGLFGETP